jgi:hypothetical protein
MICIAFGLGNALTGKQAGYILNRVVRRLDCQAEAVEVTFAIGNLKGFLRLTPKHAYSTQSPKRT